MTDEKKKNRIMQQVQNTISIPVIILTLGIFPFACWAQDGAINTDTDVDPLHDYLLEKRTHLYNFGLGKRANEGFDNWPEYEDYRFANEEQTPDLDLYRDGVMRSLEKRQNPNYFGPGKRIHRYDFGLGKRGGMYKYDFGLGKRGSSKFPLKYDGPRPSLGLNLGLGKRSATLYSSKNF